MVPPDSPPRLPMTSHDPGSATGAPHRRGGVRLLGVGALGIVVLLAASGLLLLRVAEAIVPRTAVEAIESRDHGDDSADGSDVEPLTDVQNILVVGIDSRKGLTEEEIDAISAGHFDSELTDTVMWVQFDPQESQLRMVSFPRDLRVHPSPGAPAMKLNGLYAEGGPDLLVSVVEHIVGADLDHYVQVDLAGFLHLAESLDGVEVCLEEPMVDPKSGLDLPAGCQELDAEQATGFVRARQVSDRFGEGTAGRAARQQYFIRQAIGEVVTAGTLASPSRMRAMIDLARQSVVVDEGFSTRELVRLGNAFRTFDTDQVVGATVPFTSQRYEDGLFYDEFAEGADELFAALREGRDLPADLVTTGEPDTSVSIADGGMDTTAQ